MHGILVKRFLALLLSKGLKWIPFKLISKLLNFHFLIASSSSYSLRERKKIESIIRRKYNYVNEGYVIDKFLSYPDVIVISKQGKLRGLMFINYLEYEQETYLYVGPLFFLSKLALCLGGMTFLENFAIQATCLNLLGEVQNPELIIHLHSVMPEDSTFPQIGTFGLSNQAREKLDFFIAHIKQLDQIDKAHFKSKGTYSLFKERPGQKVVLDWLKDHQVDLAQGDSLVMLFILNKQALVDIREKVWYCLLTYPAHRTHYIAKLVHAHTAKILTE
jgi:hypothetical protein